MSGKGFNELATDVDKQLQYSNRVLAQAEGTGINFYTVNFARLACVDVDISPEGTRIYNHFLLNAPGGSSLDPRLQFGFHEQHLYRNAGAQLYEYEHLLLASALGEFFSEDYIAAVFSCLADYYEDENKAKPHQSSFKAFVHSANGYLSTSQFPLIVDDRIRLNPYHDHDGGMPHSTSTSEFIPIEKVAEAVYMLGQSKLGKVKELTFVGGDVIGWFSAFIEMFLGMGQTLVDNDGKVLYQSNGKATTLKLIFMPPNTSPKEETSTTIWMRKPLNVTKRSSTMPPKLTGRVVGEALFSKVFGKAFHKLDQTEARAFGNALGGLARSWDIWAHDEDALPIFISQENKADPGSWGMGLIQTWTNWFPELRHLQGRMERALKKNKHDAGQMCEDSIQRLEPLCGCFICSPTKGSDDNPTNLPADEFCIPTMMETIIVLGLTLSRVTLVPDLFPSRAGILAMYKAQVAKRMRLKTETLRDWDRFTILFGNDWNSKMPQRLQDIITLFSGSRPTTDLPDNLLAISHEGMCAYVIKLQRGDHARARDDDNLVRVVMGHISWKQKIYSRLCLGCVQPPVELSDGWESFKTDHFEWKIYVK